jgi:hypothetical protein
VASLKFSTEASRLGGKLSTLCAHFFLARSMALGTWDPKIDADSSELLLIPSLLTRLIGYGREVEEREDTLTGLEQLLSEADKQRLAGLMKVDHALWRAAAEPLPDADLLHLIRFFAVAENLPGWEAGAASPVIPLAKVLRQRGARLDKALLQWLRQVSDNRYLPYGPL